jgi:endo-1,4-beta-mannosidase
MLLINASAQITVWERGKANVWYAKQPWLVGANYITSSAINQLEMWQAETFDTAQIAKELGWAKRTGMNTMRVFLHDLLYQQDSEGFLKRIDIFLSIAKRNNISILFVLFDSVWDPYLVLGKQREPKPHTHNSGWAQNPGRKALEDSTEYPRLEIYVKTVVKRFANDKCIWGWDAWNEPDNKNETAYGKVESPAKTKLVTALLPKGNKPHDTA